ncbi:MAG: SRPBCC family protein [Blastocatellia bacterium]|nr:SRPBCC family protein [Blastocatellia bacterium]
MKSKDTAAQLIAAATGATLAYYGFKKGGVAGAIVGILGTGFAASTLAATTTMEADEPRAIRQSVEVMASPERAFEMWSRFEDFPRFMKHVSEVRKTGERAFHWVSESPLGRRAEWDLELTASHPARYIAWRSTTPGVSKSGEVYFEPTERGTQVFVVLRRGRLSGPLGVMVEKIESRSIESRLREDLLRFKQLIETGEITTAPQPGKSEDMRLAEGVA